MEPMPDRYPEAPRRKLSPWIIAALVVVIAAAGYLFYTHLQFQERVKQEHLADETRERRRIADREAEHRLAQKRLQEELQTQKEVEEKQRQMDIDFRQAELQQKKFTADDRPPGSQNAELSAALAARMREAEQRQRSDDESVRQRAEADLARIRRELEQREYEDQMARARREQIAREAQNAPQTSVTPDTPSESPPKRPNPKAR